MDRYVLQVVNLGWGRDKASLVTLEIAFHMMGPIHCDISAKLTVH